MQITRSDIGEAAILRIEGWLDATTSKTFETEIHTVVSPETKRIVLDFRSVAYISSAGLRVVLALAKQLRGMQGGFAIFGAETAIQRVFELSGFSRIIPMLASEAEAVAIVAT